MADNIKLVKGVSIPSPEDNNLDDFQGDPTKTHFRVALISIAAEIRTIYADNAEEAIKACVEKGLGRPAGRQGPTAVSVAASSYEDSPDTPDFIKMSMDQFVQAGRAQEKQQASQILQPQIVIPPGFDPTGGKVS